VNDISGPDDEHNGQKNNPDENGQPNRRERIPGWLFLYEGHKGAGNLENAVVSAQTGHKNGAVQILSLFVHWPSTAKRIANCPI